MKYFFLENLGFRLALKNNFDIIYASDEESESFFLSNPSSLNGVVLSSVLNEEFPRNTMHHTCKLFLPSVNDITRFSPNLPQSFAIFCDGCKLSDDEILFKMYSVHMIGRIEAEACLYSGNLSVVVKKLKKKFPVMSSLTDEALAWDNRMNDLIDNTLDNLADIQPNIESRGLSYIFDHCGYSLVDKLLEKEGTTESFGIGHKLYNFYLAGIKKMFTFDRP